MPAPSLLQLSTATAVRNMKYLDDIGSIPYSLARPFLLKIESPEKLRYIELQSPHIMKDSKEIWLGFIKRDIPKWEEYGIPEEPKSWHQVYNDLRARLQEEVDKDAEKLKQAMEGINSERAKHSTMLMPDQRNARLPSQRPSQRQRYASYDRRVGGISPVFAPPSSAQLAADPLGAPKWTFERPQIPRSAEPKKSSIFSAKRKNRVLAIPTQKLNDRASKVRVAPRSLIEEHKQSPTSPVAARNITPTLRVPGRTKPLDGLDLRNPASASASGQSLQEKERKLRALTTGKPLGSHTSKSPEAPSKSPEAPSKSPEAPSKSSSPSISVRSTPTSVPPTTSPVVKNGLNPSAGTSTIPLVSKGTPPTSSLQEEAQKSSPRGLKRRSPESFNTDEPKQKEVKRSSPDTDRPEERKQKVSNHASPELNSEGDESKTEAQPAPRIATIRKRPASVFLPPKRKRLA